MLVLKVYPIQHMIGVTIKIMRSLVACSHLSMKKSLKMCGSDNLVQSGVGHSTVDILLNNISRQVEIHIELATIKEAGSHHCKVFSQGQSVVLASSHGLSSMP